MMAQDIAVLLSPSLVYACIKPFVFHTQKVPTPVVPRPLNTYPNFTPNSAELEHTNKKGLTPLQLAVRAGHLGVTEELLTRGARPNVKSKAGLCLRCVASSMGHGYLVVSTVCIRETIWLCCCSSGVVDGGG